jgi:hypothetical protein
MQVMVTQTLQETKSQKSILMEELTLEWKKTLKTNVE